MQGLSLGSSFPATETTFKVVYNESKHNVVMIPAGNNPNTVVFHNVRYTLAEIHAHDTTEHVVHRTYPSCELHFVFDRVGNEGSKKLVIGIRVNYVPSSKKTTADATTTRLIGAIALAGKRKCDRNPAPVDISMSLNNYVRSGLLNNYFTYCGSLTTGDHDKIVTWVVCADVVTAETPGGTNILKTGMCAGVIQGGRPTQHYDVPVYHINMH